MRGRERLEDEMEYMERHKYAMTALAILLDAVVVVGLTSSPPWKGRGFPSRGLIVPTIGSGLHPSSGGQSSGSENHSHLALGYPSQRGLSSKLRLVP